MCATWGLSRAYLLSPEQTLRPSPCSRLVPAPGRVVQVSWLGGGTNLFFNCLPFYASAAFSLASPPRSRLLLLSSALFCCAKALDFCCWTTLRSTTYIDIITCPILWALLLNSKCLT